ncbi:hypothetical protein Vafri_15617, partial [Volvox africanus]
DNDNEGDDGDDDRDASRYTPPAPSQRHHACNRLLHGQSQNRWPLATATSLPSSLSLAPTMLVLPLPVPPPVHLLWPLSPRARSRSSTQAAIPQATFPPRDMVALMPPSPSLCSKSVNLVASACSSTAWRSPPPLQPPPPSPSQQLLQLSQCNPPWPLPPPSLLSPPPPPSLLSRSSVGP